MTRVLIMAGGFGTRLHGLTKNTPKPMLTVGGTPLVEQLVRKLARQGFVNITLSVHYLADVIKNHFGDGSDFGVSIDYIEELVPLDTGGATKRMSQDDRFIVHNGDVITDIDYADLIAAHVESGCAITACAALHQHQVPYGVFDIDAAGRLSNMREKPIYNSMVNAGIYVISPGVPHAMDGDAFKMTDLLDKTMYSGGVKIYPINGYWVDIGSFETYKSAQEAAQ